MALDDLDEIAAEEAEAPAATGPLQIVQPVWTGEGAMDATFDGTSGGDRIVAGSGAQTLNGNGGRDKLISYGDAGEPDPAQTEGAEGRVEPARGGGHDERHAHRWRWQGPL